jgi:hypothetical protein
MTPDTVYYLGLFVASLSDVAGSSAYPSIEHERDLEEIRDRTANEGISFLTRTLPSLAKAIDFALATGTVLRTTGFKLRPESQIPLLFGSLIEQVFDTSGCERSDASAGALGWLRQLLYLFYKLELPIDAKQSNEVIDLFKKVDSDLPNEIGPQSPSTQWILRQAAILVKRVVANTDPRGAFFAPRHGPGAVATGEKVYEKSVFSRFYRNLAKEFPYEEYFFFNSSHLCDELQAYLSLEEKESGTAKVVLVPKDSRGPRLISCEPLEYQWVQQGLMRSLIKAITSHPLTKGHVNFDDQTVNQDLALKASRGEPWVTLDMKEASDRVSRALVEYLFPEPWRCCLLAARTTATRLPSGEVITLKKYAPMGSAICFPVEALVFWALSVAVIQHTRPDLNAACAASRVYVYGDDIIVRTEDHGTILQRLPEFGLLFNEGKCCTAGSFRESCGVDAYKGVNVTPLRLKSVWCHTLTGMALPSYVAFHNALCERGMFNAADYVVGAIQRTRPVPYANSVRGSLICLVDIRKIARQENKKLALRSRYNPKFHRREYYSWLVRPRILNAGAPGWAEMQRIASLRGPDGDPRLAPDGARMSKVRVPPSADTLSRYRVDGPLVEAHQYALPRRANLKRGWGLLDL